MGTLLTPAFGTVFWATLSFLLALFILRKLAWGPILKALQDREESIQEALRSADKAREEMANLNSDNDRLLQEARSTRDAMLKESQRIGQHGRLGCKSKSKRGSFERGGDRSRSNSS